LMQCICQPSRNPKLNYNWQSKFEKIEEV